MKKSIFILILLSLVIIVIYYNVVQVAEPEITIGSQKTYMVAGLNLAMRLAPAATFPTGVPENEAYVAKNQKVEEMFWVGETPVTYELWQAIVLWGQDNGYIFANTGTKGSHGPEGEAFGLDYKRHPVTEISWKDCLVWCNALTEYLNHTQDLGYAPVYRYDGEVLRDATHEKAFTDLIIDKEAKGFRLPTNEEWELAARYAGQNPAGQRFDDTEEDILHWTEGNFASGALAPAWLGTAQEGNKGDEDATKAAAWYKENSGGSTQVVGQKPVNGNGLGLYDMSGQVFEWTVGSIGPFRILRGGSWDSSLYTVQIGASWEVLPLTLTSKEAGFRLARTEFSQDFAGGSGSREDPFQVRTPEQLHAVRYHLEQHFIQIADIDLDVFHGASGWKPIAGDFATGRYRELPAFQGTFDGNGYIIYNLYIDRPLGIAVGLFGVNQGHLKNMILQDVYVEGYHVVGSVLGMNSGGTVQGVEATGTVVGSMHVGGLIGGNRDQGLITKCGSYCQVQAPGEGQQVGGLIGTNSSGYIEQCWSRGSVQGKHITGGLVGMNGEGGIVRNSYALSPVQGQQYAGGLIGVHWQGSLVEFCYSTGSVQQMEGMNGLIGHIEDGMVLSSYQEAQAYELADMDLDFPRTIQEMQDRDTFIGWDFVSIWTMGPEPSYPLLNWEVEG